MARPSPRNTPVQAAPAVMPGVRVSGGARDLQSDLYWRLQGQPIRQKWSTRRSIAFAAGASVMLWGAIIGGIWLALR